MTDRPFSGATGDPDDRLDPVATTARLTAAERAREAARPDRLFDDPYAEVLAGRAGRGLLRELGGALPFDNPTIPVRTRFFDDALTRIAALGLRQFVLLAAGMDTRAYRLGLPSEAVLFELDRPESLRLKEELFAGRPGGGPRPHCARRPVGVDLAGDWPSALTAAGAQPDEPTCWLVEGLTQYLTEPDVHRLLDRITELSAPGSHLLVDFVGRSLLDSPTMRPMLDRLAERGMAWRYGTEEPERLLARRHWRPTLTRMGTVGTELGRWPFPDAPRGTPGVPQGYLVHAGR